MRSLTTIGVTLALLGCGSGTNVPDDPLPELSETYSCQYGFYLGNVSQTVGLFVTYQDYEAAQQGDITMTSDIDGDVWKAELQFGSNLFANWCDDVLEADEPRSEVDMTWDVSGVIEVTELDDSGCGRGSARASLSDLIATDSEGETIELPDLQVENEAWGCIPG